MLTAVDLFAGLGGNSEGARQAGVHVLCAANHLPLAVEYHKENHPETDHLCQDLHQADFWKWPDFDICMASPCCQGHSDARGKDTQEHDASRSTAWAVVSCVEAKKPSFLLVENVPGFTRWKLYPMWKACLEALGYTLHVNVLNAADFGVPQERERMFLTGVHGRVSNKPVVITPPGKAHVPVDNIIRWNGGKWSKVNKPGRAPATLKRVANGRRQFGDRFVAPYYGSGSGETGRSIARPVGTVTTRDRWSVVDGDRLRMFMVDEYRDAMSFPSTTKLPRTRADAIFLLGNAVCPPLAKAGCEAFQGVLNN
jgi:DNA (cytosine-5)-methyltransferase 1